MSKINHHLDLYYLLAQMLGSSLSDTKHSPGQLVDLWCVKYPTIQVLVKFILLRLVGLNSEITSKDELCRAFLCGILSLEGLPSDWLKCLGCYYFKELKVGTVTLQDLDGKLFQMDQLLIDLATTKSDVHCLALSALRFEPLYRFRLVETITYTLERCKSNYFRDEVRLIAMSFNPIISLGPGVGNIYLGELIARSGKCFFICGNDNLQVEVDNDVGNYLAALSLGRARARHTSRGLYLEWVEIDNELVATAGMKLL